MTCTSILMQFYSGRGCGKKIVGRNKAERQDIKQRSGDGAVGKHQLISHNSLDGEASAVTGNEDRLVLVPAEWIEKCIRKATCEDWRIMLAFARCAGMRSNETRIQKWEDFNLANNTMIVRGNNTPDSSLSDPSQTATAPSSSKKVRS